MARIRKIEISNFRGIQRLEWLPSRGVNCLIGPGDTGKSTILDAIDLCLGARRNAQFSDADFHKLNVDKPIQISLTVGELDDALKNFETYGEFLRGFDAETGVVEDEPEKDSEIALTVMLTVGIDLEPVWALYSDRAAAQGKFRNLVWGDRVRLAPTRIGATADYHLAWRRGSVLNRLSDETVDVAKALVGAARDARKAFGDQADAQLSAALEIVAKTATDLGIPVGETVKAMLDAHSISFAGGMISLHDESGVPLRGLGLGSTRLLIAGLQRSASATSSVILVDEVEHGLEPHRIIRFLGSLGAKENQPPLQAFLTSHSPVVLRELDGDQLVVLRDRGDHHETLVVGTDDDTQGTIRLFPDAFLAPSVLVGEGATEVGFVRGIDLYRVEQGFASIASFGTALVNVGGGHPDKAYERATAFQRLGYRIAVLRDDDVKPNAGPEQAFLHAGGEVFACLEGGALEDDLFRSLSHEGVAALLARAVDLHGEELVAAHIESASNGRVKLDRILAEIDFAQEVSEENRKILAAAARSKKASWFKNVGDMEDAAREIIGPDLEHADKGFRDFVEDIFRWASKKSG